MNDFYPTETLKKEIQNGDISRIHSAIECYFLEDRANEKGEINKAIEYTEKKCKDNGMKFWHEHDQKKFPINQNKAEWNENYYGLQLVYFNSNFSKERVEHVLEVGKYLYSRPKVNQSISQKQIVAKKNKAQSQRQNQNNHQKIHKTNFQKKNMTLLILTLFIIAIVVVVILVLMLNNNQNQVMLNRQSLKISTLKQIEEIFIGKLM